MQEIGSMSSMNSSNINMNGTNQTNYNQQYLMSAKMDSLDDVFIDGKELPASVNEFDDDRMLSDDHDDDNFAFSKVDDDDNKQQSVALIPTPGGMNMPRDSLPNQMPELPFHQSSDLYDDDNVY